MPGYLKALVAVACIVVIASGAVFLKRDREARAQKARILEISKCSAILNVAKSEAGGGLDAHPFRFPDHPMHEPMSKCISDGFVTAAQWASVSGGQRFIPLTR